MKLAILSDIHSNLQALEEALRLVDQFRVDEIYCLGDIVGYGGNPNECVALVRARCARAVKGNHDLATVKLSHSFFHPEAAKALFTAARACGDHPAVMPMPAGKPRVLVVDDDAGLAENLAEIVGTLEVSVEIVDTAAAALGRAASHLTDLALVDIRLPDGSGIDLIAGLRALDPMIEVVLITGDATIESAIAAVREHLVQ